MHIPRKSYTFLWAATENANLTALLPEQGYSEELNLNETDRNATE